MIARIALTLANRAWRPALRGVAAATGLSLASAAVHAEAMWVGDGIVEAVNDACKPTFGTNDYGRVMFRPASQALGNGLHSYFSYISRHSGYTMRRANGAFATGAKFTMHGSLPRTGPIDGEIGTVVAWSQTPAAVTLTTETIHVLVQLDNFFLRPGCIVTMRANMVRLKP